MTKRVPAEKLSLSNKKLKYWGKYLNLLQFPNSKKNSLLRKETI